MNEIVRAEDLSVYFPVSEIGLNKLFVREKPYVRAVDKVNFSINKGEVVALVGESGCGKTTVGRALVSLIKPTGGKILYEGKDMGSKEQVKELRRKVQYIFQDPYSSLNPRMTVGEIITRPIRIHKLYRDEADIKNKLHRLLEQVGLTNEQALRFPHEFSGGQKQRISIARALAVEPEMIIADEPTAALDVSIQAQILILLKNLKETLGLTMLFITHDLGIVEYIADRVFVMYFGTIVETGPVDKVLSSPLHPYTTALISAVPKNPKEIKTEEFRLKDIVPSPINIPPGCRLHPRCPCAVDACSFADIKLEEIAEGRYAACLLAKENSYLTP